MRKKTSIFIGRWHCYFGRESWRQRRAWSIVYCAFKTTGKEIQRMSASAAPKTATSCSSETNCAQQGWSLPIFIVYHTALSEQTSLRNQRWRKEETMSNKHTSLKKKRYWLRKMNLFVKKKKKPKNHRLGMFAILGKLLRHWALSLFTIGS